MKLVNNNPATKEQIDSTNNYLKGAGIEPGDFLDKLAPDLTTAQIKKLEKEDFDIKAFKDMFEKAQQLAMKLTESDNEQDLMVSANMQYTLTSAAFNARLVYGDLDQLETNLEEKSKVKTETKKTKSSFDLQSAVAVSHKQITEFLTYAHNNKPIPF